MPQKINHTFITIFRYPLPLKITVLSSKIFNMDNIKTIGIIAEFNPFHKGHEHILKAAREVYGADQVVVVMSGDHVQRGEPAIIDKYARAKAALYAGADLVLELPVIFATGSAQYFARGAVSALINCTCVDALLFGSECGRIDILKELASGNTAADEAVSDETVSGCSSPSGNHDGRFTPKDLRLSPNDLLAVEYLKALDYFGSDIIPLTIPRIGTPHNDTSASDTYASASALRQILSTGGADSAGNTLSAYIPEYACDILSGYISDKQFLTADAYSDALFIRLLQNRAAGYAGYFDVFEDLSDKIISKLEEYSSFTAFIKSLKSKDISYSHLSRALLHILLGIKKSDVGLLSQNCGYCPWLRILGLKKDSAVMGMIKRSAGRPLLSKLADSDKLLDSTLLPVLTSDISASELYSYHSDKKSGFVSEYRRGIVIL